MFINQFENEKNFFLFVYNITHKLQPGTYLKESLNYIIDYNLNFDEKSLKIVLLYFHF